MNFPKVTVAIIAFNAEKTIEKTLRSIARQDYPKRKIEVIVVDGMSTDKTVKIASKYNAKIIKNPKRGFIPGKHLAFVKARGKYILYIDSDEVLNNKNSILNKVNCLEKNKNVKAVMSSGYRNPENYPKINNYLNEFGDPFAYFVYDVAKGYKTFITSLKKNYNVAKETDKYCVFDFSFSKNLPLMELVAMASMLDVKFVKKQFPETLKKPELLPHIFYMLISNDNKVAVMKNDVIEHYSLSSVKKYFNKLKWRVKTNIFDISTRKAGFSGRDKISISSSGIKKYLFVPYALSIFLPLYDAMYLSITRGNKIYLLHFIFTLYTAFTIIYYYILKMFINKLNIKAYGS